jgi:hypothetical protein
MSPLTLDAQVATEKRLAHVDVFQFHLNIVNLPIGLLGPSEPASGSKERRGGCWQQLWPSGGQLFGSTSIQSAKGRTLTLENSWLMENPRDCETVFEPARYEDDSCGSW